MASFYSRDAAALGKVIPPMRPSTLCIWTFEHVYTETWIISLLIITFIYRASSDHCDRIIDIFLAKAKYFLLETFPRHRCHSECHDKDEKESRMEERQKYLAT